MDNILSVSLQKAAIKKSSLKPGKCKIWCRCEVVVRSLDMKCLTWE